MPFTRLTDFDFYTVLDETAGPALAFFTGPACGSCRALKALLHEHRERFADLTLFEVNAEEEMGLTRQFDVFHLPALFLFNDGTYQAEIQAEMSPDALRHAINAALSAPPQEAP